MHFLLKKSKINSKVGVPYHANEQVIHFAFKEKISFLKNPMLEDFDFVLLFDFNDFDQLGRIRENFARLLKKKSFCVISFDHHVPEKRAIDTSKRFIGKNFSTTQLLLEKFGKRFDKKCYFYSALGILEDTGHFLVGDKKLFDDFSLCLDKSGNEYSDLLEFTKKIVGKDERIAFLKAAQRSKITEIGETIIISSNISFYQSQAASKLLDFGADIALVCGEEEKYGTTVLSCRADSVFKTKNKFNLVKDLLQPLQKSIGGEMGGHSGAAQWKGNVSSEKVLSECNLILEKRFEDK